MGGGGGGGGGGGLDSDAKGILLNPFSHFLNTFGPLRAF